jgi:hypothetical protein
MNTSYQDITDKLGEPVWYDEHCVPRYCEFHPFECDPYAQWVSLVRRKCQSCGKIFLIATSWYNLSRRTFTLSPRNLELYEQNKNNPEWMLTFCLLGGGDPPYHGCIGDTMCSEFEDLISLWHKDHDSSNWRIQELSPEFLQSLRRSEQ